MRNQVWRRASGGWWRAIAGVLVVATVTGGCSKSQSGHDGTPQRKYEVAEDKPAARSAAQPPVDTWAGRPASPADEAPQAFGAMPAADAADSPTRSRPAAPAGKTSAGEGGAAGSANAVPQPPSIAGGQLDTAADPPDTPQELQEYLKRMAERALTVQMQIRRGAATPASLQPIMEAMLEASEKLLAADADDAARVSAVQAKAGALSVLSQLMPDRPWADQFHKFATSLAADKNPVIAIEGRAILLGILIGDVAQGKSQDVDGLMAQLKALLADEHRNLSVLNVTQQAVLALRTIGRDDEAHEAFELIANAFKDHPDAQLAAEADDMLEQLTVVDLKADARLNDVLLKRDGAVAAFTDVVTQLLQRPKPGQIVLKNVLRWLPMLEQSGNYELAARICDMTQAAYQDNLVPELKEAALQSTRMMQRRLDLLGKPLSVEGTQLDGTPLDYAPYQGKVVLLVFWASVSPACRPELLAVKTRYEKYHAQGLEVIGVCLDQDMTVANQVLNELQLPWTTITNSKLAEKFGIAMVPYLLLADREGKVVALFVAPSALDAKLPDLLGPAGEATPAPPVNQLREPSSGTE